MTYGLQVWLPEFVSGIGLDLIYKKYKPTHINNAMVAATRVDDCCEGFFFETSKHFFLFL
jgi:hypothetical protein